MDVIGVSTLRTRRVVCMLHGQIVYCMWHESLAPRPWHYSTLSEGLRLSIWTGQLRKTVMCLDVSLVPDILKARIRFGPCAETDWASFPCRAGRRGHTIQPIDLVRGVILRKCGSASATPLGGKYIRVCSHTIKNSYTVVQVHEVDTCSDRWLITVVLSAAQTVWGALSSPNSMWWHHNL